MVRVNEVFDFFFDCFGVCGDVFFGEELFIFIVVEFIIANWADFGGFRFLAGQ